MAIGQTLLPDRVNGSGQEFDISWSADRSSAAARRRLPLGAVIVVAVALLAFNRSSESSPDEATGAAGSAPHF
jgi:hypothetical protein